MTDKDTTDAAAKMREYERLAEAAYDAMYEASAYSAKDHFDDARGYFFKAIEAAKQAAREADVARLTARRDHIVAVYNRQFRGLR